MAFLSVRTYCSISFPKPLFPWPVVRREALVKSKKGQIRLAVEKRAVIRWEPELSCSAFGLFQSLPRPLCWTRVTKILRTILTYPCGTEQVSDRFPVIISNTQAELLGYIAKVERSVTTNTFREIPPLTVSIFVWVEPLVYIQANFLKPLNAEFLLLRDKVLITSVYREKASLNRTQIRNLFTMTASNKPVSKSEHTTSSCIEASLVGHSENR